MSELFCWRRRADEEDGFALIVVMVVISIVTVMTIGMLATGLHLEQATTRDRRYGAALQVAEAGVERALYDLATGTTTPSDPQEVPGGEYDVSVTVPRRGWATIDSTGYVPNADAPNALRRRVRVTYGPERAFEFALFSDGDLEVKNNGDVVGDVFANQAILLRNNKIVQGSVISATGTVELGNNAEVRRNGDQGGDVRSGGYDASGLWGTRLGAGAVVEGSVTARAAQCPGVAADSGRYNISNAGAIQGNATARGSINGSVGGNQAPFTCVEQEARRELPGFTYVASNYTNPVEHGTAPDADGVRTGARTAFQAWVGPNSTNLQGTHRVMDTTCRDAPGTSTPIDLGSTTITGDFTLITNCRIDFSNNVTYSGSSDAEVNIISLNSSTDPPAVDIKNNFTIPDPGPAVLLYSTGLVYGKNNLETNGTVVSQSIFVENNMDVTYDARVERITGFGTRRYERISWEEIPAGS
ncbi:MAG: polymer-forming cytoskeletal protein [Acidimicrobiia bacterium]|nr:polymer-forming cytoskeletal protein [Acidimicrobiia bacterium]